MTLGSLCRSRDGLHRDLLDDGAGDSVDEAGARERRVDPFDLRLIEPAGSRRRAERAGNVVGGTLRGDRLVGASERLDRRRPDRVVHRVAGRQRGGDDRRSEHEPDDDQGAAPGPALCAADGELQQDAVPHRECGQHCEGNSERHRQDDEQRVDGDAEELLHRYATATAGMSARTTS